MHRILFTLLFVTTFARANERPNIVFILADDLGWADTTLHGHTKLYNVVDDTSPTSNAPLRGGKASQFEGGIRVPMIVAWPGNVASQSRNNSLVQSTDFYPTLLEILNLEKEEGQIFDGINILPALKGELITRDAIFTYFPHNPPVPDWIPPSISIHHENWKLIREFHQGDKGAHRHRLFDLGNDIGEKKNLAAAMPDLVAKLDAKIETFLKESQAVVPLPNPKFDPAKYQPELEGKNRVGRKPAKGSAKKKTVQKRNHHHPPLKITPRRKRKSPVVQ